MHFPNLYDDFYTKVCGCLASLKFYFNFLKLSLNNLGRFHRVQCVNLFLCKLRVNVFFFQISYFIRILVKKYIYSCIKQSLLMLQLGLPIPSNILNPLCLSINTNYTRGVSTLVNPPPSDCSSSATVSRSSLNLRDLGNGPGMCRLFLYKIFFASCLSLLQL